MISYIMERNCPFTIYFRFQLLHELKLQKQYFLVNHFNPNIGMNGGLFNECSLFTQAVRDKF